MKKALFLLSIVLIGGFFDACEKTDYQHPLHRANQEKNK
jgi:hypothetical protein